MEKITRASGISQMPQVRKQKTEVPDPFMFKNMELRSVQTCKYYLPCGLCDVTKERCLTIGV